MYNPQKKLWQFTCQHGPDECLGNIIQVNIYNYKEIKFDL